MPVKVEKKWSKESTIYHYTLLGRVRYKKWLLYLYWLFPAGWWAWDLFRFKLWSLPAALLGVGLLQTVLIFLLYRVKEQRKFMHWRFNLRLPWLGWVPGGYVSLEIMLRLHWQLCFIILAVLCFFYPWIRLEWLIQLIFVHLWILFPRLWILVRFFRFRKLGYLKLNEHDSSCYSQ